MSGIVLLMLLATCAGLLSVHCFIQAAREDGVWWWSVPAMVCASVAILALLAMVDGLVVAPGP